MAFSDLLSEIQEHIQLIVTVLTLKIDLIDLGIYTSTPLDNPILLSCAS